MPDAGAGVSLFGTAIVAFDRINKWISMNADAELVVFAALSFLSFLPLLAWSPYML